MKKGEKDSQAHSSCSASLPKAEWCQVTRQDRRGRPGPLALASPFAWRRELLPTSPNFLDDRLHSRPINYTFVCPITRPPQTHAGCHLQALSPQLRTTSNAQTPRCLPYACPSTAKHLPIPRHARPQLHLPRLHLAIDTSANPHADA